MKIAFFANPDSTHDAKWINRLARRHDVMVISGERDSPVPVGLSPEIRVEYVLSAYSVVHARRTQRQARLLRDLCGSFRPDIVHSMYAVPNAIWGDAVASGNHVITTRGSDLLVDLSETLVRPRSLAQLVSFPILRYRVTAAIRRAAYVTSTSARQRRIAARIRGSEKATQVIRTGVDASVFAGSDKEEGTGAEPFILLCPRSMKPLYNTELLVTSMVPLRCRGSDARVVVLRLIDDHPGSAYSNRVREVVERSGLSATVEFLPPMTEGEIRRHYEMADAVIMVPRSDGTPVSAVEAMLMRRPLVVGSLDYDEDLFNSSTVWKIPAFSPDAISETVAMMMTNRDQRERRVENAHRAALQHANLDRSLESLLDVYAGIHERGAAH